MRRKRPALTPSASSSASIEEAYNDLSRNAFAIWIRLMVTPERELEAGRKALARSFGCSVSAFNRTIRELKLKGYVDLVPQAKAGEPSTIVISKRARLVGRDHFVKLSH